MLIEAPQIEDIFVSQKVGRTSMRKVSFIGVALYLSLYFVNPVAAQDRVEIEMFKISKDGLGAKLGHISAFDTQNGFLALTFALNADLPPGGHGLHVHENGSCDPAEQNGAKIAGLAAGGHYDPEKTGRHEGPSGTGHLGDLPILFVNVDEDGAKPVTHTLVAPRLKLGDIRGLAIVIHEGSDNYRDEPKPLGGGGPRIACGVVPN